MKTKNPILFLLALIVFTFTVYASDEVIYVSVEEQMRNTMELAKKFPNATPQEIGAMLGGSHGGSYPPKSTKQTAKPNTAQQIKTQIPPAATTSTTTAPPPSTPTSTPTSSTTPKSTTSSAKTTQAVANSSPIATPDALKSSKDHDQCTGEFCSPASSNAAFFAVLFFLVGIFVVVVYWSYLKWMEMNGNEQKGLYQPIANEQNVGDDSDGEFDDIEMGNGQIEHGQFEDVSEIEALDSISNGKNLLNAKIFEKNNQGNGSGFDHQEVSINNSSSPMNLKTLPPQSLQDNTGFQQNQNISSHNSHNSPHFQNFSTNVTNILNSSDSEIEEVWDEGGNLSLESRNFGSNNSLGLQSNHIFDSFNSNTPINKSPMSPLEPVSPPLPQTLPQETKHKPSIISDSISLGMMLGASYTNADSRVKSLPSSSPSSSSPGATNSLQQQPLQQQQQQQQPQPPMSSKPLTKSGGVQVVMKADSSVPQSPKLLSPAATMAIASGGNSATSIAPIGNSIPIASAGTTTASFTPIKINTSTIPLPPLSSTTKLSATLDDFDGISVGGSKGNNNNSDPGLGANLNYENNQNNFENNFQQSSSLSSPSSPPPQSPQPQSPQHVELDLGDEFESGLLGDDDNWFDDVPDTSTALDLIQKSNNLLADLNL